MRSADGTKSGEPSAVTLSTNLMIACFAAVPFHEGSGSAAHKRVAIIATTAARSRLKQRNPYSARLMISISSKGDSLLETHPCFIAFAVHHVASEYHRCQDQPIEMPPASTGRPEKDMTETSRMAANSAAPNDCRTQRPGMSISGTTQIASETDMNSPLNRERRPGIPTPARVCRSANETLGAKIPRRSAYCIRPASVGKATRQFRQKWTRTGATSPTPDSLSVAFASEADAKQPPTCPKQRIPPLFSSPPKKPHQLFNFPLEKSSGPDNIKYVYIRSQSRNSTPSLEIPLSVTQNNWVAPSIFPQIAFHHH